MCTRLNPMLSIGAANVMTLGRSVRTLLETGLLGLERIVESR